MRDNGAPLAGRVGWNLRDSFNFNPHGRSQHGTQRRLHCGRHPLIGVPLRYHQDLNRIPFALHDAELAQVAVEYNEGVGQRLGGDAPAVGELHYVVRASLDQA